MKYVIGKSHTITSGHEYDKNTRIAIIGNNCLILENESESAVVFLSEVDRGALVTTLNDTQECRDLGVLIGKLNIEYSNRGEPYMEGVEISLGDVVVFIRKGDIPFLLNALTSSNTYLLMPTLKKKV